MFLPSTKREQKKLKIIWLKKYSTDLKIGKVKKVGNVKFDELVTVIDKYKCPYKISLKSNKWNIELDQIGGKGFDGNMREIIFKMVGTFDAELILDEPEKNQLVHLKLLFPELANA